MITQRSIDTYCNSYACSDHALTTRQRRRMALAIVEAESVTVLYPTVNASHPRVMQAWVTMHPTDVDHPDDGLCEAVSVIRRPRYAVREREAPKRSTLLSRLWSLLR